MKEQQVIDHFKKQAQDYINLMTRLIPEYTSGQNLICEMIPFSKDVPIKVLDLGTGTGGLAELVLKHYPLAKVHAFDLTDEMLTMCQERLKEYKNRLTFQQGDFRYDPIGTGFDVVLAGLTLHHLTHIERKAFFNTLYESVNEGGIFLSRDVIVDDDESITQLHYAHWRKFMFRQGEEGSAWYKKHLEKDHPVTIDDQLAWLKFVGFLQPACHWRYWNFAIFSGRK